MVCVQFRIHWFDWKDKKCLGIATWRFLQVVYISLDTSSNDVKSAKHSLLENLSSVSVISVNVLCVFSILKHFFSSSKSWHYDGRRCRVTRSLRSHVHMFVFFAYEHA